MAAETQVTQGGTVTRGRKAGEGSPEGGGAGPLGGAQVTPARFKAVRADPAQKLDMLFPPAELCLAKWAAGASDRGQW